MKLQKTGTYKLTAEPFHTDFTGRLFWGTLSNYLLTCAEHHASERGFGMVDLQEEGCSWVLSRLAIEMHEMPTKNEVFSVDTWIENVYRLFTDRNFSIYGLNNKEYGYARSVWAMINMNTRKPVDLLSVNGNKLVQYMDQAHTCPIDKPERIKVTNSLPINTLDVTYSDIDINGHVNSIKYIEHISDLFPIDWYKSHQIIRFEIAYVAEAHFGDKLNFFVDKTNEETYNIEVRKTTGNDDPEGEVICRSKVRAISIK